VVGSLRIGSCLYQGGWWVVNGGEAGSVRVRSG